MLREVSIVIGTIAIPLLLNLGIFRAMYGKRRPTKILGKMVPSIVVVAISFFILGKTGTARLDMVLLVFVITALTVFFNFIIVGSRLLKPLNAIAYGLIAGGRRMTEASGEVFSASQSLAEGASQQAAGLEESSSSLEEMASMAKQIAENAHAGKAITEEAKRVIEEMRDRMGELTLAMEDITRSSQETGKIVKTIDGIAFQTNLLALNASVEAARAGAAGAGFSVVAGEVRKLALNAAKAAKNSSELIEKTMISINNGNRLKTETEAAFVRNMEMSAQVGKLIDDIAEASKQEADGIAQVSTAVAEMDKVVQQSVTSTGALASAAEDTSKQAEKMKDFVTALADLFGVEENGTPKEPKRKVFPARENAGSQDPWGRLNQLSLDNSGGQAVTRQNRVFQKNR